MRGIRCAVLAVTASAVLVVAPAATAAADVVDDGVPGLLTVEVNPLSLDVTLAPGERAYWPITPRLDAPDDGELTLQVRRSGVLALHPEGLRLELRECSVAWEVPAATDDEALCAGTVTAVVTERPFAEIDESTVWPLGAMPRTSARYLLATIALADPAPAELQGELGAFAFDFRASGDEQGVGGGSDGPPDPPGPDRVALTGVALAAPLALAAVLGAVGAVLRRQGRGRSEEAP